MVSTRQIRLETQGLTEVLHGLGLFPLKVQDETQVVVGLGTMRINGQGLVIVSASPVDVVQLKKSTAQVVVGLCILRLHGQGFLVAGYGICGAALFQQNRAQVMYGLRVLGSEAQCL